MTAFPPMALLAALLACAPAARAQDESDAERLGDLQSALAHGDWNGRMHAVHELAPLEARALPLLRFAADDADWQVRLAAVHGLGRVGPPAIPALAEVLKKEPCRTVRISAIHWLGSMGEPAAPVLERALDDESRMLRLEDRYWLDKLGRAPPQSGQEARVETTLAEEEDLRLCAGSPEPGRLHTASRGEHRRTGAAGPAISAEAASAPSAPPSASDGPAYLKSLADARDLARTPPASDGPPLPPSRPPETLPPLPRPRQNGRSQAETELLALAARAKPEPSLASQPTTAPPETLPPGPAVATRGETRTAAARLSPEMRAAPALVLAAERPRLAHETIPAGPAGPSPREEARPAPRLEADAGGPKPKLDPVPVLVAQLSSSDPRARARAADELGKRGPSAAPALPALRRALRDRVPRVRAAVALALGNLDAGASVAELARAARDKDEDVRWSATVALGRIKTPAARAAFRRLVAARVAPPSP